MGLIVAWQILVSEHYFTNAKWYKSLISAQFAAEMAPFNAQAQRAPAELFVDARIEVPINVAIDVSRRALEKDPYGTDIMVGLADFYAQAGDLRGALSVIELAERLSPKNFDVIWAKREIMRRLGDR